MTLNYLMMRLKVMLELWGMRSNPFIAIYYKSDVQMYLNVFSYRLYA